MNKFKNFVQTNKRRVLNAVVCSGLAVSALACPTFASEQSPATTALDASAITDQFNTAAGQITPIIMGILGAGLGIFVIFVAIRLGKKMFTTVSKG